MEEPNGNFINLNYTDSLLTSLTNAAGQTISFTYNSSGRLATVVDAITAPTRTFSYAYDNLGNLKEVTDPLGGINKYTYLVNGPMKTLSDKNNNVVDIIYFPDLSTSELIGCNKRLSFSYDTASLTTVVTDHLNTGNQVTTYKYQKLENLAWITSISGNCCGFNMTYEFDANGNKIKETDANGNIYTYTYDATGNMLTMTDPQNQTRTYTYTTVFNNLTSYTDAKGNIYTLSYNATGNLTQLVAPGNLIYTATYAANGDIINSTDPKGNIYTYNYDTYGNPTNVTAPNGYNATLVFNARGNLLAYTDARGNTNTAEFDILDRLKKITDPNNNFARSNYDAEGNPTSIITKNNETSLLSYDASNRLVKIKDPIGNSTEMYYDGMNNLVGLKNALNNTKLFTYDTRNRLKTVKDPLGNTKTFTYDANGNITNATLANGEQLTYSYDNVDRLTTISDITGSIAQLVYDKNSNIISYANGTGAITTANYDSLNRLKTITDPLGKVTNYNYDKNSNVTSITDRNGFTKAYTYDSLNRVKTYTDNNGFVITVSYDAEGNIANVKDQNNNITAYTYDNLNRLKRTTYPNATYLENTYDVKNNIIAKRLADGSSIIIQYDSINRPISKTLPDGVVYAYTYDALGRIISATNNNGTVNLTYDKLNRITSETYDGRTIRYEYNIAGRTQTTIYPDSTIVTKDFDTRNRLVKVSKNTDPIVTYQYNNADQNTVKTFANGIVTNMQYDFANRLNNISTANGNIQNTTFTYDYERNKTAINRLNTPTLSEQFVYDNGYRVTNYKRGIVGSPLIQNTYTFDAVGNRLNANLNGIATTYTPNNLNQLTNSNNGSQNINFTYDGRGNLTYDGLFYKTYDADGRLLKDSSSPANVLIYKYDAFNRRIQKILNGNVLKYTYSGLGQIEERNGSNSLLNRTVFTNFLNPVLNEKNGNSYYYHQNELNSVEAISGSNGNMKERYQYDLYGKPTRFDSAGNAITGTLTGNRIGFTGQEYDSASGSYRFFFRNYSPSTGTFNQRDLIGYADGMGMYQYVGNNPANGVDVLGLECPPTTTDISFETVNSRVGTVVSAYNELFKYAVKSGDLGAIKSLAKFGKALSKLSNGMTGVDVGFKAAALNTAIKSGDGPAIGKASANMLQSVLGFSPQGAAYNALDLGQELITDAFTDGNGQSMNDNIEYAGNYYLEDIYSEEAYKKEFMEKYTNFHYSYEYWNAWKEARQKQEDRIRNHMNRNKKKGKKCPPEDGTRKNRPKGPGTNAPVTYIQANDPNLIIGPEGEPSKAWVAAKDRLPYTVLYENDSTASAPAKYVKVIAPIKPKEDAATFQLGNFGFNNQTFSIPPNTASYYQRLDCRDSMGLFVDITAGYDQINNVAFWELQSIDPLTLLPPSNPLTGFLFLQDTVQENYGHGFVNFSIKPKTTAVTLDSIEADAFIIFDQNDTVATNIHKNTIDAVAPTSSIANLPDLTPDTEVNIHYTGTDDANGSGIKWYAIYVADGNGQPELYVSNFTKTDTIFRGLAEHTYKFYISATDTAGNIETLRLLDSVKITNGQYIICPGANVGFDSKMTGSTFQWQADNGTGYSNITNGGIYAGATTSILSLNNPPTSMYGFKYRCLVNGNTYSLEFILKFGMTWEGTISNVWENPANWSCNSIPDINTDVTIDAGKLNYPQVNVNTGIRTIRVNNGATLTVKTGATLQVIK
jgi:RHS repeat-associated protein